MFLQLTNTSYRYEKMFKIQGIFLSFQKVHKDDLYKLIFLHFSHLVASRWAGLVIEELLTGTQQLK